VLSVEDFKAAYEKLGVKPVNKIWDNGEGACCAMTAYVRANIDPRYDPYEHLNNIPKMATLLNIEPKQVKAFIYGFDDDDYCGSEPMYYDLGCRTREALIVSAW